MMFETVKKNDKTYNIKENEKSWTISTNYGSVPVTFNLKKKDCATLNELKKFIYENETF